MEKNLLRIKNAPPYQRDITNPFQHTHHQPQHRQQQRQSEFFQTKTKKSRRDKSDLGEHFIAPDGGWAWLVCVAAGVSNLSIYPCLQQFGFMFRERLAVLGLSSSEITTIINTNPAISACTGLLNGPMFRRFTFRQVALAGSLFIFTGIILTAFCSTFFTYLISYSVLFGFGMGINVSASSLAINTYFKNKRRRATGFSWTVTGLGPIFLPYFVTFLLSIYGVQGTVLIFASLSLHSAVSALIYQPVRNHVRKPKSTTLFSVEDRIDKSEIPQYLCKFCEQHFQRDSSIFSSQYLFQEDDPSKPGYEIIEPGTPMLSRANDGWFGSKLSLTPSMRCRNFSMSKDPDLMTKLNSVITDEAPQESDFLKPNHFKLEHDEALQARRKSREDLWHHVEKTSSMQQLRCTCNSEPECTEKAISNDIKPPSQHEEVDEREGGSLKLSDITFAQKIITFFDLDLLRDFTYVNLVAGLTIINFGELNFSILTPFILNDLGFDTAQITLATSVLASLDITFRFLVPFVTEKISWDNRVFFLIGVVGIALGRTVVACTHSYPVILCSFVWIGMCKGVRTIFWPLIIPGYVPLKRLPAASGLQLLISGLFTLAAGPFVGLVRDRWNYSFTLHCLNMMTFIAAISWSLEAIVRSYWRKRKHLRKQNKGTGKIASNGGGFCFG